MAAAFLTCCPSVRFAPLAAQCAAGRRSKLVSAPSYFRGIGGRVSGAGFGGLSAASSVLRSNASGGRRRAEVETLAYIDITLLIHNVLVT